MAKNKFFTFFYIVVNVGSLATSQSPSIIKATPYGGTILFAIGGGLAIVALASFMAYWRSWAVASEMYGSAILDTLQAGFSGLARRLFPLSYSQDEDAAKAYRTERGLCEGDGGCESTAPPQQTSRELRTEKLQDPLFPSASILYSYLLCFSLASLCLDSRKSILSRTSTSLYTRPSLLLSTPEQLPPLPPHPMHHHARQHPSSPKPRSRTGESSRHTSWTTCLRSASSLSGRFS